MGKVEKYGVTKHNHSMGWSWPNAHCPSIPVAGDPRAAHMVDRGGVGSRAGMVERLGAGDEPCTLHLSPLPRGKLLAKQRFGLALGLGPILQAWRTGIPVKRWDSDVSPSDDWDTGRPG